ncbi:MAG: glycerol-3-phosphate acyltransferase [Candidatus Kapabacteria bacterium]|nr:glycerol-3-phosphate acyltransferase [Candidatus Kapabacteria bacterium]
MLLCIIIVEPDMPVGVQLLCMMLGYALGALPTVHILARWTGQDKIRETGLDQMPHKATLQRFWEQREILPVQGVIALLDAIKGFVAVNAGTILGGALTGGESFLAPALTGVFAVLGHNYNLLFRRAKRYGRGLAIVAGVMLAVNVVPVVIFVLCWLTGYVVIRRSVYVAVTTGALATPVLMYNAPEHLSRAFMRVHCEAIGLFTFLVVVLALQVFVRYLEPMRLIFRHDD